MNQNADRLVPKFDEKAFYDFLSGHEALELSHMDPPSRDIVRKAFSFGAMTQQQQPRCTYPECSCPHDPPANPNWCARGFNK